MQLGHRTSKDLDFYTEKSFEGIELIKDFKENFPLEVKEVGRAKDTVWLKIKNIDLSFFRYPYKLIRPLISYLTVDLSSPQDITAMKIEAIIGRGTKRDFVDIYYLMRKYSLKQILRFTQKKYSEAFNELNCLQALMYFKDAETLQKDRKRIYLYDNLEWKNIKAGIEQEVKKYQKSII